MFIFNLISITFQCIIFRYISQYNFIKWTDIINMDIYPKYFKPSMTNLSTSPAIMESIDNPSLILTVNNQQDIFRKDTDNSPKGISYECSTLNISSVDQLEKKDSGPKCFLLINEKEQLKVFFVLLLQPFYYRIFIQ